MTDTKQPEAQRLADGLNELDAQFSFPGMCGEAASELRRLHDQNAELLEALRMNAQALAWLANGKCRGFHPKLPTANVALDAARAAIAKTESAS